LRRHKAPNSKENSAIIVVAILEILGLTISIFVGYWVRDRPELLVDVFKTFLTVLLLPAVTGILGFMRNDSTDLAVYNAHRISNLEQNAVYRGSDATPEPDFGMSETTTVQHRVSVPDRQPPFLGFPRGGFVEDNNDPA
jgi:hypothetical protein